MCFPVTELMQDGALWEVLESRSLVTCGRGRVLFPIPWKHVQDQLLQDCDTLHSHVPLSDLEWGFVIETHRELNPKLSYNQPKSNIYPVTPPAAAC